MESGGGPAFSVERTRVSGRRFVAHMVDGTLYAVLFVLLILVAGATNDVVLVLTFVLGLTVLHVAYFVVLQRPNGRTPGKALVGSASSTQPGRCLPPEHLSSGAFRC